MIGSQKSVKKGPKQITRFRKLQIGRKESQNGKTSQIGKELQKEKKKGKKEHRIEVKGEDNKRSNPQRTKMTRLKPKKPKQPENHSKDC